MSIDVTFVPSQAAYKYCEKTYEIVYTQDEESKFYTEQRAVYEPEAGETIFIIARHGENESNVNRTYDGRTLNLPLTDKGHGQGRAAGQKLKERIRRVDAVITNSMFRTEQTAARMMEAFPESDPSCMEDDRLLERWVGPYEGGSLAAIDSSNKKDKACSADLGLTFEEKMRFVPEEGIESYADIWTRVHESLQEHSSNLEGRVALIVTHSGTMRSIYWHLAHQLSFFVPYANFKPDNGAYMVVSVKEGKISLLETNDIRVGTDLKGG